MKRLEVILSCSKTELEVHVAGYKACIVTGLGRYLWDKLVLEAGETCVVVGLGYPYLCDKVALERCSMGEGEALGAPARISTCGHGWLLCGRHHDGLSENHAHYICLPRLRQAG